MTTEEEARVGEIWERIHAKLNYEALCWREDLFYLLGLVESMNEHQAVMFTELLQAQELISRMKQQLVARGISW